MAQRKYRQKETTLPSFSKEKVEGKNAKFVREKLFINSIEYSQKLICQRIDAIRVLSWNVYGLKKKLGDIDFIELVNQNNII